MISFLKNFFAGDAGAEEQALRTAQATERQRDILRLNGVEQDEQPEASCGPKRGCGGCGCG